MKRSRPVPVTAAVFVENPDGAIEPSRLPKPGPKELAKLVERIARRTLAVLREEMSEVPRPVSLDRLQIGAHRQQSFPGGGRATGAGRRQAFRPMRGLLLQAGRHATHS